MPIFVGQLSHFILMFFMCQLADFILNVNK